MKKTLFAKVAAIAMVATFSVAAQAQVFTPTYTSPRMTNDIGIHVNQHTGIADPAVGNLSVEGIWRGGPLGLRAGVMNRDHGGSLVTVGAEARSPVHIANAPLGLAFTMGAQGIFGAETGMGAQAGLSAGYTFLPGSIALTPYIHPRIGLVNDIGGVNRFELQGLADAGVDVEFWNNMIVRVGANLTQTGANWGVGLAVRQ